MALVRTAGQRTMNRVAIAVVLVSGLLLQMLTEPGLTNSYANLADAFLHGHLDVAGCFDIACAAATPTTYTLTATGRAARGMSGFTFTVDQANARATSAVPGGWTTSGNCWVVRKNGDCS